MIFEGSFQPEPFFDSVMLDDVVATKPECTSMYGLVFALFFKVFLGLTFGNICIKLNSCGSKSGERGKDFIMYFDLSCKMYQECFEYSVK